MVYMTPIDCIQRQPAKLQLDEILTAQRIAKTIGQFTYGKASSINSVVVNISRRKVDLLHKLLGFHFLFKHC